MRQFLSILLLLFAFQGFAQDSQLALVENNVNTSLRGLYALNDSIVWTSGSNGYVGHTEDAGTTWKFIQIPGYDSAEFRDIHVFDENTIIVMSSVQPASILKSIDGGKNWKEVYRNDRKDAFLDGMDFLDNKGICIGDPIDGAFLLLKSTNKGEKWEAIYGAKVEDSIYAFAASGTGICIVEKRNIYFATGGKRALLYYSKNFGKSWMHAPVTMQQGDQSKGIFSIDFIDKNIGAAVGGDYTQPNDYTGNFTMLVRDGNIWKMPLSTNPDGYRSCIKFLDPYTLIACGPTGVDVAHELNWKNYSLEGFNTIAITPQKHIFLAGNNGKIGILILNKP